jgi:hypothetical protein
MIKLRDIYVREVRRSVYVEDVNGVKPAVVFDNGGVEFVVLMKMMCDGPKVIRFEFMEGPINSNSQIIIQGEKAIFAGYSVYINTTTGDLVSSQNAFDVAGDLLPNLISEFEYYTNSFGKTTGGATSIYAQIQDFISNRFADGLQGYQPIA